MIQKRNELIRLHHDWVDTMDKAKLLRSQADEEIARIKLRMTEIKLNISKQRSALVMVEEGEP